MCTIHIHLGSGIEPRNPTGKGYIWIFSVERQSPSACSSQPLHAYCILTILKASDQLDVVLGERECSHSANQIWQRIPCLAAKHRKDLRPCLVLLTLGNESMFVPLKLYFVSFTPSRFIMAVGASPVSPLSLPLQFLSVPGSTIVPYLATISEMR